jgi:hypothetical protein
MTSQTPEDLQAQIASNTQSIERLTTAISQLVVQFIRPNAQQALSNYERLERIEGIVEAIATQQQVNTATIATIATQQQANTQQISANTEAMARFDQRLENTRALVAENGSQIAQLRVIQQQSASQQDLNVQAIAELITENRAFRESQQSQLAAIIVNGRRIDRLEQQAS